MKLNELHKVFVDGSCNVSLMHLISRVLISIEVHQLMYLFGDVSRDTSYDTYIMPFFCRRPNDQPTNTVTVYFTCGMFLWAFIH